MDQPRARDRPGIDHRIERPIVVGEPNRIERLAARLYANRGRHALFPYHFQRQRKYEGLGNRLNGERHGAVADFVDVAIDGDESNAEMCWISSLQLRDVVCDRTGIVRFEFFVAAGQELPQRRLGGVSGILDLEIGAGRTDNLGVHDIFLMQSH